MTFSDRMPTRGACRLAVATCISMFMQNQVQAQQRAALPAEEIVVTSSRVGIPQRQLATSVAVLDQAAIEARGNVPLTDILRQMPAISTTRNGGAGMTTTLRIRGEDGFRTLALFDGLRLSDPSSPQIGPQLEHVLSSGVGRVEILRGPQGLSYGADAGGVLNVSSRRGDAGLQAGFDAQVGSYDTRQYSATVGGAKDRVDFFATLADFRTGGFNTQINDNITPDRDGYENTTFHGRAGADLSGGMRLDLVHRRVDGEAQSDGCSFSATQHDCLGRFDLTASRVALSHETQGFSQSLAYSTTATERENLTGLVATNYAEGELNRWEYMANAMALPGFDLVFGADVEEALNNDAGRDNTGVYLEYLSDFSDRLFLTAGVRHDDNDDFGTNLSRRVSAAWLTDLEQGTLKLRGSYGTGFRAPSPFEIAYNTSPAAFPPAASVRLGQERSVGYEAAVEYLRSEGLRLEVVYFDQDIEDAIYFDLAGFSGYLQDSGISNSRGVELSGELELSASWRLNTNYTWNATARPDGEPRLRRPRHMLNLGLSWSGVGDRLRLNGFYRVARDAVDQSGNTSVPLGDFQVLDFSGTYALNDSLQLYARVENVFGENYQEVRGYNTADRAAYVGFRLSYTGF